MVEASISFGRLDDESRVVIVSFDAANLNDKGIKTVVATTLNHVQTTLLGESPMKVLDQSTIDVHVEATKRAEVTCKYFVVECRVQGNDPNPRVEVTEGVISADLRETLHAAGESFLRNM